MLVSRPVDSRAEEQRDGSAFHCKFVLEIGSRRNGIGGAQQQPTWRPKICFMQSKTLSQHADAMKLGVNQ